MAKFHFILSSHVLTLKAEVEKQLLTQKRLFQQLQETNSRINMWAEQWAVGTTGHRNSSGAPKNVGVDGLYDHCESAKQTNRSRWVHIMLQCRFNAEA